MNHLKSFLLCLIFAGNVHALETATLPLTAISYYPSATKIEDPENRCKVDLRLPPGKQGFPTLVWFHGGGMTGGTREFPQFKGEGVAFVSAGYRLSPQVPCPVFIEDAAAAVAWTVKNIASYGGDPKKIFVGGHSAGGYLALMVGLDPVWLKPHHLTPDSIAALIPVSAQVTTHFQVKALRGNTANSLVPVIDEFAPLHFSSKDLRPICLITGDRRIEFKSRVEENELFHATLRNLGNPSIEFHELKNLDHATVVTGAAEIMPAYIDRISQPKESGKR